MKVTAVNQKTKKRIALEWLSLLACLAVGLGVGYLVWSNELADADVECSQIGLKCGQTGRVEAEESFNLVQYADVYPSVAEYLRVLRLRATRLKEGLIAGVFLYALIAFVRSVVWAVTTVSK